MAATTPTQMRLEDEDLGRLDWLAEEVGRAVGTGLTRSDAARMAIRDLYARKRGPKRVPPPRKKVPKNPPPPP
jgi:hypothetical protein